MPHKHTQNKKKLYNKQTQTRMGGRISKSEKNCLLFSYFADSRTQELIHTNIQCGKSRAFVCISGDWTFIVMIYALLLAVVVVVLILVVALLIAKI